MTPHPIDGSVRIAFAGAFARHFVMPVSDRLAISHEVVVTTEDEAPAHLADVHALVTLGFTRAMGAAARHLRLVQVPGAGLDRIDRAAMPTVAWLANAYGHEIGIAEHAIGAMLTLTRDFARIDAKLRRGEWDSQWAVATPAPPLWPELTGKTLGILGFGRIGRALARRARAFDMRVWATRAHPSSTTDADADFLGDPDAIDHVLAHADYLAITLALTPDTRGLLDEKRLASMKPGAILVNVARAEVVDESALYRALAGGALRGAALDVWYRYPTDASPTRPSREPFHELPNVLMTPHVSGWTEGMLRARADVIAENVTRAARGEAPVNLVPRA